MHSNRSGQLAAFATRIHGIGTANRTSLFHTRHFGVRAILRLQMAIEPYFCTFSAPCRWHSVGDTLSSLAMSPPCLIRALVVGIVMLSGGCRLLLDLEEYENSVDASTCPQNWIPYHFDACDRMAPMMNAELAAGGYFIDTASEQPELVNADGVALDSNEVTIDVITQADNSQAVLLQFNKLTIASDAYLRAWSTDPNAGRPLILAAWNGIDVYGRIDVSSVGGMGFEKMSLGAGANSPSCGTSNGSSMNALSGGGGGGFLAKGGGGGRAMAGSNDGGLEVPIPTVVRGGCAGGHGQGAAGAIVDTGGHGGGAVMLSSRSAIVMWNGSLINAGGAGGQPGSGVPSGGGGGGSGGFIGFDAPTLLIQSNVSLAANGGGGAGGRDDTTEANPGLDAMGSATAAAGGNGSDGTTAKGGDGGYATGDDRIGQSGQEAASEMHGTGGGGGGAGFIVITETIEREFSPDPNAEISPGIVTLPDP